VASGSGGATPEEVALEGYSLYKLGSLVCGAQFEEPAFQLSQQSHLLHKVLFHNVRELDPRVDNFVEDGSSSGAAHWSLTLTIPPRVVFRARVQGFETTFSNPGREIDPSVGSLLEKFESGVAHVIPEARILVRDFIFNAHFELPDQGAYQVLTGPFLGEPPGGLGVQLAQGMSFYFRTPESNSDSALTLDRSVPIAGGIYFQVRSRVVSQGVDLASSFSQFKLLLARAIEALKLGDLF
jgi:hypothetical protein